MKKKLLASVLAVSMMATMMVGCGSSSSGGDASAEGEKVTLSFLNKYPDAPYAEYFEQAVADFEAANPNIDIEMENVSDEAIKDKLTTMAGGGEMPDIFFTWTGERVNRFARNDLALDLTPYLDADPEWKDGFLPAFLNNATLDGKNYAIPFRSGIMFFLYNKEVFTQNNLETPKTWDELLAVCEQLKAKNVTPIAFGNSAPWYSSWWIGLLNAMMVPAETTAKDYTPETGEFTDPNYEAAVQAFFDLNDKGYFGDNVNAKDYYEVREAFMAGQSAMILDATPQFTQYDDGMGAENWGFFKVPIMEGSAGDPGTIGGGGEAWIVSSKCEHPDEAVAFLKFMTSLEQGQKQTKESGLPNALVGGITNDNATESIAAAYAEAEGYTNIADWLDCAVEASIADQYMVSLQEGFDGKSAADVMKDVQGAATKVREEYAGN